MAISPSKMHIADLVAQEEDERIGRYERAWKAYDGEGPKPLEVEQGQADDNIRLDYAELIVDKGVSFLVGKGGGVSFQAERDAATEAPSPEDDPQPAPTPEPEPDASDDGGEEEQALAELDLAWPATQRKVDFHNLATNGGICGHAWLRLYESGKVSVLDPSNVTAVWSEDDISVIEGYLIEWNTVDQEDGLGVLRRKRIEPDDPVTPSAWAIYDEEYDDDSKEWRLLDETAWAHPYAPVLGAQNLPSPNTFYGQADLKPAILDQIEQLESVASDMRRILRLQGHPVPVVIGEEAHRLQEIDVAIGELLAIPNKEAKLSQLAIAELTSALALFQELKTSLFEGARIPKIALGDTANAGPTTGVALRVEYEPLIEKTETKWDTYGLMLTEAASRILDLRGLTGWRFTLSWPDLLPADSATESQTDETELRMGIVSRRTIAEKRGYDWDVEQQRISEETPNFDAGTFTYTGGFGNQNPPPPSPPTLVPVSPEGA